MTAEQLAELAREVEIGDAIDWQGLNISADAAYLMMASQILTTLRGQDEAVLLATITKLVVENFTLNLRLLDK